MTREDIDDIINAICPNDEDYEKPCISPKYLRQELEQLALDQRQWNKEPTTKNTFAFDCISRGQALNEFCIYNSYDSISVDKVRSYLKALTPVVSIEPNWISVSERLPEPNAHDGLIVRHYLIQNEYEDMLVASYDGIGWKQMYQHEYLEDDVIAWMPLPKLYEPQENEA